MYSFFGIATQLNLINSAYKSTLLNELIVYQSKDEINTIKITDDWSTFNYKLISNNPSSHFYYENAIYIKEKMMDVAFVFDNINTLKKVYFKLNFAPTIFRRTARKWLNMQFTNRMQNIGQIFHENILIPMIFFNANLVPIHASGVEVNESALLFGGTGGVGKTTLELELCFHQNHSFITDDIAIMDINGSIFPNYNYPKIYGYNLIENSSLNKTLFKNESVLSKLHWFLHKNIFGLNKVRRKISPFDLYKNVLTEKAQLKTYFILSKNDCNEVSKTKLGVREAINMTTEIIFTEYAYFFNHIRWHHFNAIINKKKPILTVNELEKKWAIILNTVFKELEIYMINIPLEISHNKFKKQTSSLFLEKVREDK